MVLSRYITAEIARPLFLGVGLLVVVFTNLGSSIGTFVAFPMIVRVLHGI